MEISLSLTIHLLLYLDCQKLKCVALLSIFTGSINIYKHKIGTLHLHRHFDSELEQNFVNCLLKLLTSLIYNCKWPWLITSSVYHLHRKEKKNKLRSLFNNDTEAFSKLEEENL